MIMYMSVCVCVCVWERERERERISLIIWWLSVHVLLYYVYVFVAFQRASRKIGSPIELPSLNKDFTYLLTYYITNEEVCRKIHAAIGEYMMNSWPCSRNKTMVVSPHVKVFWFSKDNLITIF